MHSKSFYTILGLAVLTGLGLAIYFNYYQDVPHQQSDEVTNAEFVNQRNNGTKPINDIVSPSNGRIPLTPENVAKYFVDGCSTNFNNDPANEFVNYSNKDYGFSAKLPYNQKWGDDKYQVTPYDELPKTNLGSNEIGFIWHGPMGAFEGGGCARGEMIRILPAKTAQARIKEITTNGDLNPADISPKPKVITINNFKVVEYGYSGLCDNLVLEVIGKKYNYEIGHLCDSDKKSLESIINSMKLIQ